MSTRRYRREKDLTLVFITSDHSSTLLKTTTESFLWARENLSNLHMRGKRVQDQLSMTSLKRAASTHKASSRGHRIKTCKT